MPTPFRFGPQNRNPLDGFRSVEGGGISSLPNEVMNTGAPTGAAPGPTYLWGGLVTYEKPLKEFTGDIAIGSSQNITFQSGLQLPNNCTGFRVLSVVPGVQVSINNSPWGTVVGGDNFNFQINTLAILTDAVGSCILQAWGTGD